ncbi:hypothetical protein AgCh_024479 [Apium graveolens]
MGERDEDDDDDMSSHSSYFINHVKGEQQPLYPGCESYTKMKVLVQLYNLKVKHVRHFVERLRSNFVEQVGGRGVRDKATPKFSFVIV